MNETYVVDLLNDIATALNNIVNELKKMNGSPYGR